MRAGKAVMSARSLQQLLWVALGGACTAETLQPADQPPLPRNFLPAALYIHCATEGGHGPCALDPRHQQLNIDTLIDRPDVAPAPIRWTGRTFSRRDSMNRHSAFNPAS